MSERGFEYLQSDVKRKFDIAAAAALSIAVLPVATTVGGLSAVDTRRFNPFFRQTRVGKDLRKFEVLKFRSIRDTEHEEDVITMGTFDPRASKIGLFLRQTGLDELPQLKNVFEGHMSIVGHRPLLQEDLERRQSAEPAVFEDWFQMYQAVRPGLIGNSQIMRHRYVHNSNDILVASMLMDLDYAQTASLRFDTKLVLSCPFRMLHANVLAMQTMSGG